MMQLKQALRLEGAPQVAFVGAGGKTTAMFQLARQFERPVLVTTSTHLSAEQVQLGDEALIFERGAELGALLPREFPRVVALSGPRQADGRMGGLSDEALVALSEVARREGLPLLIEADGARLKPFKAPEAHEPAIPGFVDAVVVVAGLSALSKPLDAESVHRPERFAALAGASPGAALTVEHLAKVLGHQEGGLKNIPQGARRVALLNQVEDDERAAAAKRLADPLLEHYDAVLAAALAPSDGSPGGIGAVYEPVAGILLAAGGSERLGRPKQLLDWRGKPFVRQIAESALQAKLFPIQVVTGAHAAEVQAALDGLPVELVHNPDWEAGQSSSVKAALEALPKRIGAAIFMVVDQPQLPVSLLEALRAEHARSLAPIIATQVDGQRSNPVLFDRRTFPDFAKIQGDVGGRALFARHRVSWLPWLDASLGIDVDTPEDYQRLLDHFD